MPPLDLTKATRHPSERSPSRQPATGNATHLIGNILSGAAAASARAADRAPLSHDGYALSL